MKKLVFAVIVTTMAVTSQRCGESEETPPVDCTENPVSVATVSVGDANCGLMNGSIEVRAMGGSGNYQFKIGDDAAQTSSVFTDLGAGTYEVTAIDDNECSATMEISVANLDGLNITFEASPAGCKTSDGSLTVSAVDGTEPYQFKLDNESFGSANVFDGLSSGNHTLVVTDATGCEITQDVRITSGVSFAASISPIISTKCAVSGCHSGSQFPDFRSFKNIHDNAAQIKTLTGNRTMPQEGSLTQAQIDMIACWVDDGALEN